jgi:hypothetical protein
MCASAWARASSVVGRDWALCIEATHLRRRSSSRTDPCTTECRGSGRTRCPASTRRRRGRWDRGCEQRRAPTLLAARLPSRVDRLASLACASAGASAGAGRHQCCDVDAPDTSGWICSNLAPCFSSLGRGGQLAGSAAERADGHSLEHLNANLVLVHACAVAQRAQDWFEQRVRLCTSLRAATRAHCALSHARPSRR